MKTLSLTILKKPSPIPHSGIVLRATRKKTFFGRKDCAFLCDGAVVKNFPRRYPIVAQETHEISEGDILLIHENGYCEVLWDVDAPKGNCLFVSDACNAQCPMCPQPPQKDDLIHHRRNLEILRLLKNPPEMICVTGGEPFLFPDRVVQYFQFIRKRFPRAAVSVLTNGICLADFDLAKKIALNAPWNTMFCVSFHADTPDVMRRMNGAYMGFERAARGIMNLGLLRQNIEIRPVVSKANRRYLRSYSEFIYRNFPFACHVAFMGQEICGNALKNYEQIWADPLDYADALADSVLFLDAVGMSVSIYNIPLCLLPPSARRFAVQSISEWKQTFLDVCASCSEKSSCCGVFSTSGPLLSRGISPIEHANNQPKERSVC